MGLIFRNALKASNLLALVLAGLHAPRVFAASNAASIIASAKQIPNGEYYVKNVATGEELGGDRNNMYPVKGSGTPVQIAYHNSGDAKHTVMGKGSGSQRKCVAAQWSYKVGDDNAGAMYTCELGSLAVGKSSGLRTSKQAFVLVPADTNAKRDLTPNVKPEERSIFDDGTDDGLDNPLTIDQDGIPPVVYKRSDESTFEKRSKHKRAAKHFNKRSTSYGPYYIIATDQMQLGIRALSNEVISSLGQKVLKLAVFEDGDKSEMWEFIPV